MFTPTHADLLALAPEIVLAIAAGLILVIEAFSPALRRHLSELTLIPVGAAIWARWNFDLPGEVWAGMLRVDGVAAFVDLYILAALFLTVWMAGPFLRRLEADNGEFYALLVFASIGAMVMASSVNLLPIFLGLELSVDSSLRPQCLPPTQSRQSRGGPQVLSSSAPLLPLLWPMAWPCSSAQQQAPTWWRSVVRWSTAGGLNPLLAVGLAMVIGGLCFKLALVPCHAWAPDVYQGSPTPVTAFLSVVPKGAALIVLLRLADGLDLFRLSPRWVLVAGIIAVASQTLGNVVAVVQRDVKRMLAYSGIAHMGYAMVAIMVAGA